MRQSQPGDVPGGNGVERQNPRRGTGVVARRACAIACAALALAVVQPATADVVEPDGRATPTAQERAALNALGVVYPDGGLGGTAFLVGDCDVLVTAKHTVFDRAGRPRADRFLYYPMNGDHAIEALLPGSMAGNGSGETADWVVMRLAEPDTGCRPLTVAAVGGAELLARAEAGFDSAGFHADLGGELMISRGCTIVAACRDAALSSAVFTHDCDTDVGASGSPLFAASPAGVTVFGMHIRGHGPGADICSRSNLALRIDGAFHDAIGQMIAAPAAPGPRRRHPGER